MEILEGLLRTHPSAGDDVAALLEVAALLGLGDRSEEAELLVAQVHDATEQHVTLSTCFSARTTMWHRGLPEALHRSLRGPHMHNQLAFISRKQVSKTSCKHSMLS